MAERDGLSSFNPTAALRTMVRMTNNMNDLIRTGFHRGRTTVNTSEPTSEVQRWTAELREATEAKDTARMAFCDGKLTEALNGPAEPSTSFNGGVQRPVPQSKSASQQMNDMILRRWRGH